MINCPYCSSLIPDNASKCPVCGGDIAAGIGSGYSNIALEEGSIIFSKYKIEKILGQGGFGITYLAYDEKLDRKVAIKEYFPDGIATRTGNNVTIPPTLDNNENLQNFKNEAKSIAKLKNPGIVDVYDVIEENDTVYIVMEYIEGTPLSSLLGKTGEQDAVRYIEQITKAVGMIHSAGLLHQDIKPENIILKNSGDIKIIDFGSSRVFAADKTKTYEKILTPGYAPLEQYGGKGKRGEYTDVYAICATLYALLKGFPPPEVTELVGGISIDFSGINERLKYILDKGLSIKIPERIQNTAELMKLLDEFEKPPEGAVSPQSGISNRTLRIIPDAGSEELYGKKTSPYEAAAGAGTGTPVTPITPVYSNKNVKLILVFITAIIVIASSGIYAGWRYYYFKNGTKKNGRKNKNSESGIKILSKNIETHVSPRTAAYASASAPRPKITSASAPPRTAASAPAPRQKIAYAPAPIRRFTLPQPSHRVFSGSGYEDFSMSGCFYCHTIYGKGKQGGYNLSHIGSRLSYSQIENQIKHPSSSMPPNPNMPSEEVAQISGWLESLK